MRHEINLIETFATLEKNRIRNSVILLDIDGTITHHDGHEVPDEARCVIEELLRKNNLIYLLSNNKNIERGRFLARALGVTFAETPYRKPDKRTASCIPTKYADRKIFVIGDKFLTDGLFAIRLGATFFWVRSIKTPTDAKKVRASYAIDTIIRWFFSISYTMRRIEK